MSLSTTRKVSSALMLGVALLLMVGGIAAFSTWRLVAASGWVSRTHEVRTELVAIVTGIAQAEAGVRAKLVTGDAATLTDYRAAIARANGAFDRVRALTAGQPELRTRLDTVGALLRQRGERLERVAALAEAGRTPPGELARMVQEGRALTVRLMAAVDDIDAVERTLLDDRIQREAATARTTAVVTAALVLLAAALALLARQSIQGDLATRLHTEQALRISQERFRAVFEQTFQLAWLLTPTGEVLELNEFALAIVGAPRAAVIGRPLWELDGWEDREPRSLRDAIADAAGGSFVGGYARIRRPAGEVASLELSIKPTRDADGRVTMLVVEARDVTEQQAAERALRASEAKFANILAIAADAIITVDSAQRILHFNQGAETIFGYTAQEVMGRPLDMLLPERVRRAHPHYIEQFGESGETARRMGSRREVFGLRKSGEEFPAEASISVLESDGQRLFTAVLRDTTEWRRVERQQRFLAEAGEVLAGSLEYQPTLDHIARLAVPMLGDACVLDIDTGDGPPELGVAHVESAIGEAVRVMRRQAPAPSDGHHPLAVVRRTGEPLLLREIDDELLESMDIGADHRETIARLGVRSALFVPLFARGQLLGILSSYSASRSLDDDDLALAVELSRLAALAIDNARAYRAARQATRARDEVLGIVSHDLRNPISVLGMCAHALAATPTAAEVVEVAETIRSSTQWMQHIIRDLLDVSAIEAGRLAVYPDVIDALPIVESVRVMHEPIAAERGIELTVEIEPGLPRVEADADRVVQAMSNLLGNALKFTPRGGRVTLSIGRQADGVGFRVTDTGPGILEEHMPHLFDRFWQLRKTRRGGAGLGLAIARGIAEAHGGRIEARSVIGEGSSFLLVIPEAGEPSGAVACVS